MIKHVNGVEYDLVDPTGNMTALVKDEVADGDRISVATSIMSVDKDCEQVGYIGKSDKADIRLYMAAGEFCGNATMSAAAFFCDGISLPIGESRRVLVESSGVDDNVLVDITREPDDGTYHCYSGRVHMPPPAKISLETFEYEGIGYELPLVSFDGIDHVIMPYPELSDAQIETAVKQWWNITKAPCFGVMAIDNITGTSQISADIRPIVYAPAVDTCYWETSCASGTTAVAAWLRRSTGREKITLYAKEPGGMLSVNARDDNTLILGGHVKI